MAQQSYGLDQVMESMMEISNILDSETRTSYKTITIGRGRRQQLINSTGRFSLSEWKGSARSSVIAFGKSLSPMRCNATR